MPSSKLISFFVASLISLCIAQQLPEGNGDYPNNVAATHKYQRTAAYSCVNFFVPIDTTAATKLTGGLPLVPREKWNPPLAGFPTGKVPLVVNRCYSHDIRQTFNLIIDFPAEIDSLSGLSYYVAFVDVLKNGVTPFQYPAGTAYVGPGEGNQIAGGVVPSLASILFEGITLVPALFNPTNGPYYRNGNQYFSQANQSVAANPASGPAISYALIDIQFNNDTHPAYKIEELLQVVNQVLRLTTGVEAGKCQRNNVYYNETFAAVTFTKGDLTIYSTGPKTSATKHTGVSGFSGNGQNLGNDFQDCKTAAEQNDPDSWLLYEMA